MVQATCIQKFRDKHNQIYGYRLQDTTGKVTDVKSDALKRAIRNNQINVTNLTLTSDNRLVDGKSQDNTGKQAQYNTTVQNNTTTNNVNSDPIVAVRDQVLNNKINENFIQNYLQRVHKETGIKAAHKITHSGDTPILILELGDKAVAAGRLIESKITIEAVIRFTQANNIEIVTVYKSADTILNKIKDVSGLSTKDLFVKIANSIKKLDTKQEDVLLKALLDSEKYKKVTESIKYAISDIDETLDSIREKKQEVKDFNKEFKEFEGYIPGAGLFSPKEGKLRYSIETRPDEIPLFEVLKLKTPELVLSIENGTIKAGVFQYDKYLVELDDIFEREPLLWDYYMEDKIKAIDEAMEEIYSSMEEIHKEAMGFITEIDETCESAMDEIKGVICNVDNKNFTVKYTKNENYSDGFYCGSMYELLLEADNGIEVIVSYETRAWLTYASFIPGFDTIMCERNSEWNEIYNSYAHIEHDSYSHVPKPKAVLKSEDIEELRLENGENGEPELIVVIKSDVALRRLRDKMAAFQQNTEQAQT